jgi:GxxExxY protein
MHTDEDGVSRITERVIGGAFQVLNTLGVGFLERVYENALVHELRKRGLDVVQQHGVTVIYDGVVLGAYNVDLLVEAALIVELKAVKALDDAHAAQCLNYLKAT